jgi:HD-GYP domain-containing protein (c-di-GMP phosphodiesterase class II)
VEAISSNRPYRPGRGIDVALEEIISKRGVLYEPAAVNACVRLFQESGFSFAS